MRHNHRFNLFLTIMALMLNFCFLSGNSVVMQVRASESDAAFRGFEIDSNWSYVDSYDCDQISIDGTTYHYGYMDSWFGIYRYYNATDNEMYVLLLSSVESKPTTKSYWDQKRWNTKEMTSSFSAVGECAEYCSYSPKAIEGTITTSVSVNISIGSSLNAGLTYGQSYTNSEITISAENDNSFGIKIKYYFQNYGSNTSTNNICCSTVDRQNFAIYKISGYTASKSYRFTLTNTVSIYRNGVFNSSTENGTLMHTFSI